MEWTLVLTFDKWKNILFFVQLFIADGERLMFNEVTSAGVK